MAKMSSPQDALQAAGRLRRAGQVAEAVEICKEAISRFPFDSDLLNTLGLCYFSLGQAVPAAQAFGRAITISPKAANMHYNLGQALEMQDRWSDALPAYRRATELAPTEEPPYLKLAELLITHGKANEADELLTAGQAHLPNSVS